MDEIVSTTVAAKTTKEPSTDPAVETSEDNADDDVTMTSTTSTEDTAVESSTDNDTDDESTSTTSTEVVVDSEERAIDSEGSMSMSMSMGDMVSTSCFFSVQLLNKVSFLSLNRFFNVFFIKPPAAASDKSKLMSVFAAGIAFFAYLWF